MLGHGEALKAAAERFKADGDREAYTAAVRNWRDNMAADVKAIHCCEGAVASGGFHNMTPTHHGTIGQILRTQYAYLSNAAIEYADDPDLVLGLVKGRRSLEDRTGGYAESGRGTFNRLEHQNNVAAGKKGVVNVLEAAAHHCEGSDSCVAMSKLTADGPVAIDDPRWIVPGFRKCRFRCKCETIYTFEGPNVDDNAG